MPKPKLESLTIHAGENGGHRIVHEFARQAGHRQGAANGGMYLERPPAAEHFFGPDATHTKLLAHIASALGLKTQNESSDSESED